MIFRKIVLKLKWFFQDLMNRFGVRFKKNRRKGEVQVVCFHGICEDHEDFINGRFLKKSQASELLQQLKTNFSVISIEQFLADDLEPDRLNIVITADDGYRNNKTLLLPLLEEYELPVCLFVNRSTGLWMDYFDVALAEKCSFEFIHEQFPETLGMAPNELKQWGIQSDRSSIGMLTLWLYRTVKDHLENYANFHELMPWEELEELKQHPLVTLGNHGAQHISYTANSYNERIKDFKDCHNYLEDINANVGGLFAYPFGHYSEEITKELEAEGATCFIALGDPNYKGPEIDRLVINPFISVHNQIIAIANGKY